MYPVDNLSLKEQERLQEKKLREQVRDTYKNSTFYRELFDENNIKPEDIQTIDDLKKIPFTTKDDLRNRNWDLIAMPSTSIVDYLASGGTTGIPVFVPLTGNDILRICELMKRNFSRAGITEKDVIHMCVTMDNLFIGGYMFYLGITGLKACAIRHGPGNSKRQIQIIENLKATGIIGVTSYIHKLAKVAEDIRFDTRESTVKKLLPMAEAVRNKDLSPNKIGKLIMDAWGAELCPNYGFTEMETAFNECDKAAGFHLEPEYVIAEIINPKTGERVEAGETGELVVTPLDVEAFPLIRYRSGDITFMIEDVCECGSTVPRIGPILGRADQLMKIKGVKVYPSQIEECLINIPEVDNYVIKAYTDEDMMDRILLLIGTKKPSDELVKRVKEDIRAVTVMTPDVKLLSPDEVSKTQFKAGKRKPKKFIDNRSTSR